VAGSDELDEPYPRGWQSEITRCRFKLAPTSRPLLAVAPSALIDAIRDRYTIDRELGRGGMATVYLVRDLKHDRLVALKVLHPELAAALGSERFLREIKLAARLQHPHILPVFDSGEAAGSLWYAMPFVEGESLRDRLARHGELPVADAVRILRDIAGALDYAHRHGVVHRDVKPENVLLSEGGALVADFGVAKALTAAAEGEGLTATGLALGTPAYMAPEQATGDPSADHRADLYALGVVAYELVTGQAPFAGRTAQALMAAHATETPEPITRRRPTVPPTLAFLVMRLLEKRPADRPQSAEAVLRELDPVSSAPTPTTAVEVRRPRLRRRIWAATGIAAVLVAAGIAASRAWSSGLDPKRIAVAVFENRTGNRMLDPIGGMAADWLSRGLAQSALIDVVDVGAVYNQGRTASGEPTAPRDLARRNGAGLVIAGSYYRSADSVVIQASVLDTRTGRVVRAFDPVRAPGAAAERGIETLRDRVMGGVAVLLSAQATPFLETEIKPPNFAAYREFLAGQESWYSGYNTEAFAHLKRVVVLDSNFVTGAAWLSAIAAQLNQCRLADSIGGPLLARPDLSEWNRSLLIRTHGNCGGDVEERYQGSRRLASLYPKSSYARFQQGTYAVASDRPREGLEVLLHLEPSRDLAFISDSGKALYYRYLLEAYRLLGDHRTELQVAERFERRNPLRLSSIYYEARALATLGRTSEALERMKASANLSADSGGFDALTPARVAYLVGTHLLANGDSVRSRAAASLAVEWYRSRPPEEQATPQARFQLVRVLELDGRYDEAAALVAGLASEDTANVLYRGVAGVLAARRGDRQAADSIDRLLAAMQTPLRARARASIAVLRGDRDGAIALLRTSPFSEARSYLINPEPALTSLRGYPPFETFLRPKD
jgi:TolB-like protein